MPASGGEGSRCGELSMSEELIVFEDTETEVRINETLK
jgi:hypothetical protein